jgi:polycystin 1L2
MQVDRLLPVANEEQKTQFGQLFPTKASKSLGDDHLWFSVIARPPASRFTRLQVDLQHLVIIVFYFL